MVVYPRYPPKPFCIFHAQLDREEKIQWKADEFRTGGVHLLIAITGKTDIAWGKELNLLPIKVRAEEWEAKLALKMPSTPPLPPCWALSSPSQCCRETGNGGYNQFITHCSCCCIFLRERSPSLAPVGSLSHGRQFSINFSTVSPSHKLQLTNYSSMGCSTSGTDCSSVVPPQFLPVSLL